NNTQSPVQYSYPQTSQQTGVYPVYTSVPYGINQRPYIKLAENVLPTGDKLCTYKLINGQSVTIVQKDGCPVIKTAFKVGSLDEPDGKEGMSHFIEHSVFHESEKYKDVMQAINDIGATHNAATCTDYTNYYLKLPDDNKERLKHALDIEADMVFNPKFSKLDKERKIVIKESKESENSEDTKIYNIRLKNLYSINKPQIADITAGNEESINSITQNDMLQYHQYFYIPQNATTSVVTPYEPDEIIGMVADSFLSASKNIQNQPIQRRYYEPINHFIRNDIVSKENNETTVCFELLADNMDFKRMATAYLLYQWFNKNTSFSTGISDEYGNRMRFLFDYKAKDKNEYLAFESLKESLSDIANNPISDSDFEKLKEDAIEEYENSFENNDSITSKLTNDVLLHGEYTVDTFKNMINGLTPQDIMIFARELDINKCSMNVLHKKGTTQEELKKSYDEYKNYITPFCIPKTTQNIDVTNNLTQYDISPYTSAKVLNTVLPDNTDLMLLDSKNDKCQLRWSIENPDLDNGNPAIKYVLGELFQYSKTKIYLKSDNINIIPSIIDNTLIFSANCEEEDLDKILEQIKNVFDIDFTEEDFEDAKRKALLKIKTDSNGQKAYDMFFADKMGKNSSLDEKELLEGLESLTINDVKEYYNKLLLNSYSTVVAKVPFEKNRDLINKVASSVFIPNFRFRSGKNDKQIYAQGDKKCYIKEKNQPEYSKVYSYKVNGNINDSMKYSLVSNVLSQRLFDLLREKMGMAYSVYSIEEENNDMGTILLNIT
ncbi:MAG: insulinase family protein, partial [Candidatus Gastranaerophilales bacterium]|nr:insulinase family protein [Candidatus Gastranaerophilales bacterium]